MIQQLRHGLSELKKAVEKSGVEGAQIFSSIQLPTESKEVETIVLSNGKRCETERKKKLTCREPASKAI